MRKTRILFTIPNFDTAGSGKVLYDLVNGLDDNRFEIEIACAHNRGAFFKTVEALGYPIHILETTTPYRPYLSLLSRVKKISRFFKQQEYDVIHSWHWSSDWTEALAAKLAGIKWVYTKKAMSWGNRHWKIRSYMASFIITINDEMRDFFPWKKQQRLIPLGIDTDYYSPEEVSIESNTSDLFKIVVVANLVPVKGIEILLEALSTIEANFEFKVVGNDDNDYGVRLKQLTKDLKLEDKVAFLGKKQDVRPYIAEADLYVIPTLDSGRKEGMPMALVEVMSMATIPLGSDISGINFVLKDFKDLLFEAGNSEALKHTILKIMSCSKAERNALGADLRTYCINEFSMEKFIVSHQELYETIQ